MREEIVYNGDIYVLGLYGVPDYYKDSPRNKPEDWYWKKDSKKEDNMFLPAWNFDDNLTPTPNQ